MYTWEGYGKRNNDEIHGSTMWDVLKNNDMRWGVFHQSRKTDIMGIMHMSISLVSLNMGINNVFTTA